MPPPLCRLRVAFAIAASFIALILQPPLAASSPVATSYRVFGPLPHTSSSRAANPLLAWRTTLYDALTSLTHFPSEAAVGGLASWRSTTLNASTGQLTAAFPDADTAYEAYALSNFTVSHRTNVVVSCDFPAVIRPASDPTAAVRCLPDYYGDGRSLCPLALSPGEHIIDIHLSSYSKTTTFSCNYFFPPHVHHNVLIPLNDSVAPSLVVDSAHTPVVRLAAPHASVSLQNAHPTEWATKGTAVLENAPPTLHLAPQSSADDHYPLPRIAPRQIRPLRLDFHTDSTFFSTGSLPKTVDVVVAVTYNLGADTRSTARFTLSFDVRIWASDHSYHYTYIDSDATVQAAAALPPQQPCHKFCAVLLSTHGAGVDALGPAWAESYRTQRSAWIILPTGRRKFGQNWEGSQMQSALTALRAFAANSPGVPARLASSLQVRSDSFLQAGHSMGGHGALVIATHFPDLLLAAMPAMAWLRLDTYGDSPDAEDFSYSDATARALLSVASEEYSTDLYVPNLLGIPFLARVGSDDDNVPPRNLRKFVRLLKENEFFHNLSSVVRLSEKPGKGHWFDGVVDDDELQLFLDKHLSVNFKPDLPRTFSLVTMNPGTSGSRGGLRIMSLEVAFQLARLEVSRQGMNGELWVVQTHNVRRIRFKPVYRIRDLPKRLLIDGQESGFNIAASSLRDSGSYVEYCAEADTSGSDSATQRRPVRWRVCSATAVAQERGPHNSGPACRVLSDRRLVIVFPENDKHLQETAVLYANALYIRGVSATVTPDSDVSVGQLSSIGDVNMVLIGGPRSNRMARQHYESGFAADVQFPPSGAICISDGKRCFVESGTGIGFLSGGPNSTLLYYVAGTDREGLEAAVELLPYGPEAKVAEWGVVSSREGWGFRGLGGLVAFGYWDWKWRVEPRRTYPAELLFEAKLSSMTCAAKAISTARWVAVVSAAGILLVCVILIIAAVRCRQPSKPMAEHEKYEPKKSCKDGKGYGIGDETLGLLGQ